MPWPCVVQTSLGYLYSALALCCANITWIPLLCLGLVCCCKHHLGLGYLYYALALCCANITWIPLLCPGLVCCCKHHLGYLYYALAWCCCKHHLDTSTMPWPCVLLQTSPRIPLLCSGLVLCKHHLGYLYYALALCVAANIT